MTASRVEGTGEGVAQAAAAQAAVEQLTARRAELERLIAAKRAAKGQRGTGQGGTGQGAPGIPTVPRDGPLPCTHQQEAAWVVARMDRSAGATHQIPFALRLRGPLDVPALRRALHALVARHEGLRTRFVERGGAPRQVVDPPAAEIVLPVEDLPVEDLPAEDPAAEDPAADGVDRWAAERVRRPMDLAAEHPFRAALARVAPDDHVLVLAVHHIVADGWALRVLAGELSHLYSAGTAAALPALPVQPADYAAWQRARIGGADLARQLDEWRADLAGLPALDLPADRPRPAEPTGAVADATRRLPHDLAVAARAFARARSVSLLSVVHAALLTVLHRYTGQTDIAVGSVFGGRTRGETELLVANLANTLVLRTTLDGDPDFDGLVARCHATLAAAAARQEVPFGLVVDAVQPDRVAGRSPLYAVSLTLQPRSAAIGRPALGAVTSELLDVAADYLPTDLNLVVEEGGDGVVDLHVGYSADLFDHDRVERLLGHVVTALDGGLARPDRAAADIEVVPAAERYRALLDADGPAVERPYRPLHRLVEDVAAARPDALAVLDHDGTEHTYRHLDARADALAHRLRRHGARPGVAVGVSLPRGIDLVATLLAVWKAGAAFVPLEPDLPPARLAAVLGDAAPPVVVARAAHAGRFGVPVVDPEADEPPGGGPPPGGAPPAEPRPGDLAYLLHTSGSTGEPKGVRVPHRGVHNRIAWMQEAHPIGPGDRVLQKTPYGFDVAVWEFFWPLTTGAAIVVTAPDGHRDPHHLHRVIADRGVTTAHFVPTMLGRFLDAVTGPLPGLRRVFCSGEALPLDTAERFLATWPHVELHNLYGPTEASIDVTAWRCRPGGASVPIGGPIANTRVHVLDARLRPAPVGIPGELYLAGTGLAEGYHRRPGLTATRFVADPYGARPGGRLYATGDLVRRRADGVLEFLGRTDRQVKLRGHRIEPAEIEHAITRHPGVRQCAVVLRQQQPGGDGGRGEYLAAYLVGDADPAEIRRHLAGLLPTPMLPTAYVVLPELPVTHSGKLDPARLPEPPRAEARYAAPATGTERWLADTWRDLLGVERVGTEDDFFDLGANSLHTTQLTARIREHLAIDLAPHHLFTSPTLGSLAALLDGTAPLVADDPIVPVPRDGPLPCTLQQEALWSVQQLDPASTAYHIGFGTRLLGELDVPALQRALHGLVVRHEALRTRFVAVDGVPHQVVDPPPGAVPLPVADVPAERVPAWTTTEIRRPLDLVRGPTFRAALARVAPDEHVLALAVHHIVADGWSARILAEELSQLYGAETTGTTAALPALAVQPADHAAWQRRTSTDAELGSRLDHWRTVLADLPVVDLPTDRPRPAHPTGAGRTVARRLPAALAAAARDHARTGRVSFLGLLQAAVLVVLNRYTGQEDLPIGSIFSGRTRAETEPLVGYFVNSVVLRTRVDGDPTFAALVRRCHDTVLDATAHQDVPFGAVVDALRPERVEGRNPLFQVGLSLLPAKGGEHPRLGTLVAEPVRADTGRARFDVGIDVEDEPDGGLSVSVEYSTELFDADRIERLVDHLTAALDGGLAEPDAPADDIDILSPAERQRLLGGTPGAER